MIKVFILTCAIALILGCEMKDPPIDGRQLVDADGNVYLVKHRAGDLYILFDVDVDALRADLLEIDSFVKPELEAVH